LASFTQRQGPSARRRLLVVDEDPYASYVLRRSFHKHYQVDTAEVVADALRLIRAGARYDAILCDVRTPRMTGRDFYRELSGFAPDQAARVIFMTGATLSEWVYEFLKSVPNPYLEKPFDSSALGQRLAEALDAWGASR
jgi:CheY-like chemotaxis protein